MNIVEYTQDSLSRNRGGENFRFINKGLLIGKERHGTQTDVSKVATGPCISRTFVKYTKKSRQGDCIWYEKMTEKNLFNSPTHE